MTNTRVEMDDEMMELVNGGAWYDDVWNWTKKAYSQGKVIYNGVKEIINIVEEIF